MLEALQVSIISISVILTRSSGKLLFGCAFKRDHYDIIVMGVYGKAFVKEWCTCSGGR